VEVDFISRKLRDAGSLGYRYHVGQYLPDWHPWEDYRSFFIGKKETNGCREILGIEMPWLVATFGEVRRAEVQRQRLTKLEIDFPDSLTIFLEHASGICGQLMVDVVSPYPVHDFEAMGEGIYLQWDGRPNGIKLWGKDSKKLEPIHLYQSIEHQEGYADTIVENPYVEEIREFLAGIDDPSLPYRFSYRQSASILALIDRIEGLA
jgi:hypothetical protein